MKKLSNMFYKISNGWTTLAVLVVFLLFVAFILPKFQQLSNSYAKEAGSPDLSLFYSGERLYSMAEAYGEFGRQSFLDIRWTLDLAFPVIYTLFLLTSISWLLRKITPVSSKWRTLNLIPLSAFFFDLAENSAASLVMLRYPQRCAIAQFLAPIFTPIKWLSVVAAFTLLVILIFLWLVTVIRKHPLNS